MPFNVAILTTVLVNTAPVPEYLVEDIKLWPFCFKKELPLPAYKVLFRNPHAL